MNKQLKDYVIHHGRQLGTLIGLIVLIVVLWILSPFFLTISNLLNVAQQTSINAIIAVGMTFVIISAGIDERRRVGADRTRRMMRTALPSINGTRIRLGRRKFGAGVS